MSLQYYLFTFDEGDSPQAADKIGHDPLICDIGSQSNQSTRRNAPKLKWLTIHKGKRKILICFTFNFQICIRRGSSMMSTRKKYYKRIAKCQRTFWPWERTRLDSIDQNCCAHSGLAPTASWSELLYLQPAAVVPLISHTWSNFKALWAVIICSSTYKVSEKMEIFLLLFMRNIRNPCEDRKIRSEIKFRKDAPAFYIGDTKLVFDSKRKFKTVPGTCSHLMVKSSYF